MGQQPKATVEATFSPPVQVIPPETLAGHTEFAPLGSCTKIPSNAAIDVTNWEVVLRDKSVLPITLRIPRVWWTISESEPELAAWQATAIDCNRKSFRASSRVSLWIKTPPGVDIHVGFEDATARRLDIDPQSGFACLRLGSLANDPSLTDMGRDIDLQVWHGNIQFAVARIPSEGPFITPTASQSGDDSARFTLSVESPVTSAIATVTNSNTDHSDLTEPVIIEERPLDYSHIGIIADDPAFRWYAIQCAPNSEEKLVKALEVQLADQHLKQHVPVILFPYMLRRTLERQRLVERKLPLIIEGYIFVLMRPETHLGRFLNDKGAKLLDQDISAEWLDQIVHFKRQQPTATTRQEINIDQTVMIVDGPLKGQTGKVIKRIPSRNAAVVNIAMAARFIRAEISLDLLVPA